MFFKNSPEALVKIEKRHKKLHNSSGGKNGNAAGCYLTLL